MAEEFGPEEFEAQMHELVQLRQTGSVQEYRQQFETLMYHLLSLDPHLSAQFFLFQCLLRLKDEVMKITPVQKQTRAGQRTRFKAFVVVGASNGHVGLGVKCAKEVATAIRGAIILAKLSIVPVRRGYWGNKNDQLHTVPSSVRCVPPLLPPYPLPIEEPNQIEFRGGEAIYR